jgi:hypothetical protein
MTAHMNTASTYLDDIIGHAHNVLRRETDEKSRKNIFEDFSYAIAEILQIEPLGYSKERATNFRKEMTAYVKKQQIKMTPYKTLCLELLSATDEDYRKELFNWMSRNITRCFHIAPLGYTKECADHFYREMSTYVRASLLTQHNKKERK